MYMCSLALTHPYNHTHILTHSLTHPPMHPYTHTTVIIHNLRDGAYVRSITVSALRTGVTLNQGSNGLPLQGTGTVPSMVPNSGSNQTEFSMPTIAGSGT